MLVDATQALFHGMPRAHTLPEVEITPLHRLEEGSGVETSVLRMPSHAGTHVDAPSHVIRGGRTIDEIPLDRFTGPAVVVSVDRGPGEEITVDDVVDGGPEVRVGDMVFLHTGWGAKFGTPEYYDHPYLSPELADWLVDRGVTLLGCDFATPDLAIPRRSEGFGFPVHHRLLGSDVLIAENLAPLGAAAGRRVTAYAFPLIVRGGDSGHARIVLEVTS
jgi:kynurenine formamidase